MQFYWHYSSCFSMVSQIQLRTVAGRANPPGVFTSQLPLVKEVMPTKTHRLAVWSKQTSGPPLSPWQMLTVPSPPQHSWRGDICGIPSRHLSWSQTLLTPFLSTFETNFRSPSGGMKKRFTLINDIDVKQNFNPKELIRADKATFTRYLTRSSSRECCKTHLPSLL